MQIKQLITLRNTCFETIRRFFGELEVNEVDTPLISTYAVTDAYLQSLTVQENGYLITSPEYAMKQLLAQGSGDIYQLSHVFRGDESGHKHLQEFTMLEWYRLGFNHLQLMNEVADLIRCILDHPRLMVEVITYQQLFQQYLQIDVFGISDKELQCYVLERFPESRDWTYQREEYFDLLFTHYIENNLGRHGLQFITNYLPRQAALARLIKDEKGNLVAARFEAYIDGIELCNGFWELTDWQEQQQRFEMDNQHRLAMNLPVIPIDEQLMEALKKGLPECAGVALGIDRLLMVKAQVNDIQQVIFNNGN